MGISAHWVLYPCCPTFEQDSTQLYIEACSSVKNVLSETRMRGGLRLSTPGAGVYFFHADPCAFSAAQALKSLGFIISSDQTTRSEYLCEMSNSAVPRLSHCPSACKPQGQNAMQEKKTSFETVPKTNGQLPNFSPPRASGKASASFVLQAAACSLHLCFLFSLS